MRAMGGWGDGARGGLTALLLLGSAAGCSRGESRPRDQSAAAPEAEWPAAVARNRIRGVILNAGQPKPDFRLTTVDGAPFDFRRDTEGYLTLLFFGYMNCPDVCPVHMANLGRVISELPVEAGRRIRVVFVTTDPERDTPDKLRAWLAGFHPAFIGLTGTPDQVKQAQLAANLLPAARELPDSTKPSEYFVSHAAQVIAFTPDDNLAHVVYPFGVRQQDWANDLPILVKGWPE